MTNYPIDANGNIDMRGDLATSGASTLITVYRHDGERVAAYWGTVGDLARDIDHIRRQHKYEAQFMAAFLDGRVEIGQRHDIAPWSTEIVGHSPTVAIIPLSHKKYLHLAESLLGGQLSTAETGWLYDA